MTVPAADILTRADLAAEPDRRRGHAWWLLAPSGVLIAVLFVCCLAVLRISFGVKYAEWTEWSLASYETLLRPYYARIFMKTLVLALASGVLAVLLGFPVALYMARTPSATMRRIVLICVMLPMLVSLLVQSYGWIALLGPDGLLNRTLAPITGLDRSTMLLFTDVGVLLGLVQTSLPLAVLPMANAFALIPRPLEEAASVLGAPRWVVYREVILPLAWPGILTGALLVFAFNAGAFAVPMLIGGLRVTTVALVIRDNMGALMDWPLGAALSVVLVLLVMAVLLLRRYLVKRATGEAGT